MELVSRTATLRSQFQVQFQQWGLLWRFWLRIWLQIGHSRARRNVLRAPGLMATGVSELRYDPLELSQDGLSLSERHRYIEFVETSFQRRPRELYTFRTGDLFTDARKNPLVGIEELLEEFFTRTEANELEFLAGFAGEANQSFCQLRDAHRLPHVEHENVAVPADSEGLQYQAHRLRNGHEKAGDFGVSDGDGPVLANLLLKDRNHAAVRSEDIAEPHRDTAHSLQRPSGENQFSHPLGAAHDVGRVHGLVGGNHQEG